MIFKSKTTVAALSTFLVSVEGMDLFRRWSSGGGTPTLSSPGSSGDGLGASAGGSGSTPALEHRVASVFEESDSDEAQAPPPVQDGLSNVHIGMIPSVEEDTNGYFNTVRNGISNMWASKPMTTSLNINHPDKAPAQGIHQIVAIDISESMKDLMQCQPDDISTASLSCMDVVWHATRMTAEMLTEHDILSVVVFADNAHVAVDKMRMDDTGKKTVRERLLGNDDDKFLITRNRYLQQDTNLWKGLEKSLDLCQSGKVNNIILLTDGEMTAVEDQRIEKGSRLAGEHVLQMFRHHDKMQPAGEIANPNKIILNTVGLGAEHDKYLLTRLASLTGGYYKFIYDMSTVGTAISHLVSMGLSMVTPETTVTLKNVLPGEIKIAGIADQIHPDKYYRESLPVFMVEGDDEALDGQSVILYPNGFAVREKDDTDNTMRGGRMFQRGQKIKTFYRYSPNPLFTQEAPQQEPEQKVQRVEVVAQPLAETCCVCMESKTLSEVGFLPCMHFVCTDCMGNQAATLTNPQASQQQVNEAYSRAFPSRPKNCFSCREAHQGRFRKMAGFGADAGQSSSRVSVETREAKEVTPVHTIHINLGGAVAGQRVNKLFHIGNKAYPEFPTTMTVRMGTEQEYTRMLDDESLKLPLPQARLAQSQLMETDTPEVIPDVQLSEVDEQNLRMWFALEFAAVTAEAAESLGTVSDLLCYRDPAKVADYLVNNQVPRAKRTLNVFYEALQHHLKTGVSPEAFGYYERFGQGFIQHGQQDYDAVDATLTNPVVLQSVGLWRFPEEFTPALAAEVNRQLQKRGATDPKFIKMLKASPVKANGFLYAAMLRDLQNEAIAGLADANRDKWGKNFIADYGYLNARLIPSCYRNALSVILREHLQFHGFSHMPMMIENGISIFGDAQRLPMPKQSLYEFTRGDRADKIGLGRYFLNLVDANANTFMFGDKTLKEKCGYHCQGNRCTRQAPHAHRNAPGSMHLARCVPCAETTRLARDKLRQTLTAQGGKSVAEIEAEVEALEMFRDEAGRIEFEYCSPSMHAPVKTKLKPPVGMIKRTHVDDYKHTTPENLKRMKDILSGRNREPHRQVQLAAATRRELESHYADMTVRGGGCIGSGSQVYIVDGGKPKLISIEDIKAGTEVVVQFSPVLKSAKVELVTKTEGSKMQLFQLNKRSLLITDSHPIMLEDGKWQLPKHVAGGSTSKQPTPFMYSLLLEKTDGFANDGFMVDGNIKVIALGNEIQDQGEDTTHPLYYGYHKYFSNYEEIKAILLDTANINGATNGVVNVSSGQYRRDDADEWTMLIRPVVHVDNLSKIGSGRYDDDDLEIP